MKVKIVKLTIKKKLLTSDDTFTNNSLIDKIVAKTAMINVVPNAPNAIDSKVTILDEIT